MPYEEELGDFNTSLTDIYVNGKLDLDRLVGILAKRNELIMKNSSFGNPKTDEKPKNTCHALTTKTDIPQQLMAYHCGAKMQKLLVSDSFSFDGEKKLDDVYFSFNPDDIFDYLDIKTAADNMVYVADVRNAKNSRVQVNYQSGVLWEDKLRVYLELFQDNKDNDVVKVGYPEGSTEHNYVAEFEGKPVSELRKSIKQEVQGWKATHTIAFNPNRLQRYKNKGLDFLLVNAPVEVKYAD